MADPKTDAELVEACRLEMQAIIDRTDFAASSPHGLLASAGLPYETVLLVAADLTEIGKFDLEIPAEVARNQPRISVDALRRHWVYRHKDGYLISLQLSQRLKLLRLGYIQSQALINDTTRALATRTLQ